MHAAIDVSMLRSSALFHSFSDDEIAQLLKTFKAKIKKYKKGGTVFLAGQTITELGLVISGALHIQQSDWWGNVNILNNIKVREIFSLAFATVSSAPLENDVIAAMDTDILFLDAHLILTFNVEDSKTEKPNAVFRLKIKLIQNLYHISAVRNRLLTKKLHYLSCRSTRDKLLAYFSEQADMHKSHSFDIPFDRQQLAGYLSVERSALSAELSKMQSDRLLAFKKNILRCSVNAVLHLPITQFFSHVSRF